MGALALMLLAASAPAASFHADALLPRDVGRLVVKVNGVQVLPSTGEIEVPLRATGFDAVEVWFDRKKHTASMRMVAGAGYRVRLNPCSIYEIWAIPEVEGVGSFSLTSRAKSVIAVTVNGQEPLSLKPGEKTEMSEYSGGAMCMHAPVTFSVEKTTATFLFLTNEKLEVTYSAKGFSFALVN